jgi:hypothetical protein
MRIKRFFFKLTHWEFWNMHFLYFPVYFQWLYFVARSRSFFFFEASNPCMHNGGMFMVSKYEICKILPEPTCPATLLIAPKTPIEEIHERMQAANIGFPFFFLLGAKCSDTIKCCLIFRCKTTKKASRCSILPKLAPDSVSTKTI